VGEDMGEWDYLKEKTNDELLHMYLEEKKIEVKQELTMRYLYIVKSIAVQMRNTYAGSLQMEDIINEGVIAIMKGLERYDPAMNIKFETFISRRIRGMIIDLMRQNDWMPRDFRKNSRAIEEARVSLMSTLGREPTEEELAQAVQTDVKKFRKIQSMSSIMNVLSLDMIQDAKKVLSEVARVTPLFQSNVINPDADVYIKCENMQVTGSFKLRGAYYKTANLTDEEAKHGVIACSAGNHAQGVALAAQKKGIKSVICMPAGAPLAKVEATKSYGAEVVLCPAYMMMRRQRLKNCRRKKAIRSCIPSTMIM
jgi:RNA polymerase sigma factor (sigma-70 family)